MSWCFPYFGESLELDEKARASIRGEFVLLEDGYTHYELGGPQNGSPVVLLHGFSVPYFIWDPTFDFLTHKGYRVLRYDLFGRGFSDRPKTRYTLDLFCKQLRGILDRLEIGQPKAPSRDVDRRVPARYRSIRQLDLAARALSDQHPRRR